MIPLRAQAEIEAAAPYVTRVATPGLNVFDHKGDSVIVCEDADGVALAGNHGMVSLDGVRADEIAGDVLLVDPARGIVERLFRANSAHNTLLVTERCDQLCQMCSQPPKKTHDDRFELLLEASLLAPPDAVIGITGGEPTLYKEQLLDLVERTLADRPDVSFHILSNGQHVEDEDVARLRSPLFDRVLWGIPLYSAEPSWHDRIVAKDGAFDRLHDSFERLLRAGARIELRTVVLATNAPQLPDLARHIVHRLSHIESWSVMQLESIGYARNRWKELLFDHASDFAPIAASLNFASLYGLRAFLFNFPLCTVPSAYRPFAVRSISDWKQKYVAPCLRCTARPACSGFFEWHPTADAETWARPL